MQELGGDRIELVQDTPELRRRLALMKNYEDVRTVRGDSSTAPVPFTPLPPEEPFSTFSTITVRNTTQDNIQAYSALKLMPTAPARIGAEGMYDALVYNVGKPANGEVCSLCVNLDYIPAGETGIAVVSGVVPVANGGQGALTAGVPCVPDGNYGLIQNEDNGYVPFVAGIGNYLTVVLGGMSAPQQNVQRITGAFDVKLENGNVVVYDSSAPNSAYCGYIHVGSGSIHVPKTTLAIPESSSHIYANVSWNNGYSCNLSYENQQSQFVFTETLAAVNVSESGTTVLPSRAVGDIHVLGRWVI